MCSPYQGRTGKGVYFYIHKGVMEDNGSHPLTGNLRIAEKKPSNSEMKKRRQEIEGIFYLCLNI